MSTTLLRTLGLVILLAACSSSKKNSSHTISNPVDTTRNELAIIRTDSQPKSLMDLPQTQDGGFVLAPGFYEAAFKTYCLQPGTPDPSPRDAYLQGPVTGYRKEIVESILLNSRNKSGLDQRNIQLLLWSAVTGSNFDKLSFSVQRDAVKLLTPKQIFELKGGVVGVIKKVSYASGILDANSDIKRLFEVGASSYESFERLAVLQESSRVTRQGVKYDQWYKQKENYYVRYFPVSYKQVRIQVYVPDGLLDADGKRNGEYLTFDPTGQQAIPAFTNAQRLGIGAPVLEILRVIIQVSKQNGETKKVPEKKAPDNKTNPKNAKTF